ncbi:MAG: hypothetical protein EBY29_11575, partial [Planctomycetes bacterium]|nr:hypothetical protein [Planctomycetota bacterium]
MKAQVRQFIQNVVLACTIGAMGANAQTQSSPPIPSVTTPSKNASQKIEPRKTVDSEAFRAAVSEARKAMDAGDFAAAEKAYAKAVAADSSNSRAQFNQGVAQYKSRNLQGSSESFATAGQIGDPAVAEGAMFNQGNGAYSGAVQIIDSDDFKEPAAAPAQDQENTKRKEAIDAAIQAASTALTHFKDAASANQLDIDARFNAEAATRLLKMLEDEKKKEEEKKDQNKKDQDKKDQDKKDQEKKDQDKKEENKKGDQGEPKDDQSKGDQQKDQDQQEKEKQGKEGKKDEGEKGDKQEGKNPDKSENKEEKKPDQSKDGKEEAPKPEDKGQKQAEGQKPSEEAQGKESKDQESKDQAPQAGEPVKDAPLTKQEADRLLQAVRDREKSRKEDREAKELA